MLTELQEKKKKAEGGEGKGEKGKGKEEEDGEDALDWWSRYYETLKDRERNERREEQQQLARASKKKEKRTEEETEEEKMKKKIPRLTVRAQLKMKLVRLLCNNRPKYLKPLSQNESWCPSCVACKSNLFSYE